VVWSSWTALECVIISTYHTALLCNPHGRAVVDVLPPNPATGVFEIRFGHHHGFEDVAADGLPDDPRLVLLGDADDYDLSAATPSVMVSGEARTWTTW